MVILSVIVGACVLSLLISRMFSWAASKSPFWNIGFAAVIVLVAAALLVIALIVLTGTIVPS